MGLSFDPLKSRIFDLIEILDDSCGIVPVQLSIHHLLDYTTERRLFLFQGFAISAFRSQSRALKKVLFLIHVCGLAPFAEHLRSIVQKALIKCLWKPAFLYLPHKFFFLQNDPLNLLC